MNNRRSGKKEELLSFMADMVIPTLIEMWMKWNDWL